MFSKTKYFFFLFFLSSLCAFSQENPLEKNEQDKLYTPDKNSIFNNTKDGSSEGKREGGEMDINNSVKFNVSLLTRGIAGFFWERKIGTSNVTFQPGLGWCFGKDFFMRVGDAFSKEISESSSGNSASFYVLYDVGTVANITPFLSGSIRFYTGNYYAYSETFQSGYFEISTRFNTSTLMIKVNAPNSYDNYYFPETSTAYIRSFSFLAIYGTEFCTEGKIKTTHEFYFGAGARTISYTKYSMEDRIINFQTVTAYVKSAGRVQSIFPAFVIGYAFGFGW